MKEKVLVCYVDVRGMDYRNVGDYIQYISDEFSKVSETTIYFIPMLCDMELKFLYDTEKYENEIEINEIKIKNILENKFNL